MLMQARPKKEAAGTTAPANGYPVHITRIDTNAIKFLLHYCQ
jgi:hypothetical protein